MAVQLGGAYGSINLDLGPLRAAAAGVEAATRQIGDAFRGVDRAAGATQVTIVRSQQQAQAALDRLKGTLNLQQRQYQILTQEVEAAGKAYGASSIQAQKKQLALDRLSQSIANNEAKLRDTEAELARWTAALDTAGSGAGVAVSRFSQMRDGLDDVGQRLTATGAIMTGAFTAPLALAGAQALSVAGDYEQAMNLFQANSGATAEQMERASETAKALGADLTLPGASAADAGEVMLELAKAGLSVEEALAEARGTMALAATESLDNAEAAEIAAGAYNTFRKEGLKVAEVADMLASGSSASSASVRSLSQGLQQAGSSFAAANVPMRDLVAQMGLMANAGIQGSDAGTSLKTMLQRLQAPTDKAAAAMADLGISVYDSQGTMRPMRELVEDFSTSLAGLTQEERDRAVVTIFGADAQRAANIVLAGGVEQYDKMFAAVGRAGAATDLAGARMKGLSGAVEGLKSSVETALLTAVEPFLPALTGLITTAAGLVGAFGDLPEPLRNAAVAFAAVLAAAGPVLLAVGGLAAAAAAVSAPLLGAAAAVAALAAALASGNPAAIGAAVAIGAYLAVQQWGSVAASVSAIAAQTAALWANAGAALAASGPFIVLAAAIAGAVMIYQKWQNVANEAADLWLRQNPTYLAAGAALEQYAEASGDAQEATRGQADALRQLRAEQEADIRMRAELVRAGQEGTDEYAQNTDRINERTARMKALTAAIEENLDRAARGLPLVEAQATAEERAARATARASAQQLAAAGDIEGALLAMRRAAGLTDEVFDQLQKDLGKAAEGGREAFAAAVGAEAGFFREREGAARAHTETMAGLRAELASAGTDAERAAIQERLDAEERGYRESEAKAAESYARQQAGQLAHLGQMLIDYTTAQATMAGIAPAQIAQMTTRIAAEYGVQTSLVDRSFGEMTATIDAWVANGGRATDQYVAGLVRVQDQTVELQREVDRQSELMTAAAREQFQDGTISLEEYVEKLRAIPAAAEAAASALTGIPTRVDSTVTVTTVRREVGGQASGDVSARGSRAGAPGASGTRARGGPVGAGSLYEVSEGGRPELLAVGGRTYLMMGAQAGTVLPALAATAASAGRAALAGASGGGGPGPEAGRGGGAGGLSITVAPVFNGITVDTAARIEQVKQAIVEAAQQAAADAFGRGVSRLIQGGGVRA